MSAMDRVLATAELLEAIVLELPPGDTLLNQHVRRQWRDMVATSPDLQAEAVLHCELDYDTVLRQAHTRGKKLRSSLAPT